MQDDYLDISRVLERKGNLFVASCCNKSIYTVVYSMYSNILRYR